jgi:hypothetical protein
MEATLRETARTNKYTKVIELCLEGAKQVDVAREFDWSAATASRVVNSDHVKNQLPMLRAAALTQALTRFQNLLDKSFTVLESILESPMVERNLKARVAVRMVEVGLAMGMTPSLPHPDNSIEVVSDQGQLPDKT